MSILNGLRAAWIKLSENKNNVNANERIVYSEDNETIEKKLDEILEKLCQIECNNKSSLRDSLYYIFNRESKIYPSGKINHKWKYKLVINKEDGTHHFELSVDDKKIMIVDTKTTLNGDLLDFNAMYHIDITEYLSNAVNKGTSVIKIDCSRDGDVTLEDKTYFLDLLNNKFSSEALDESIVAEYQISLGKAKSLK